jgi:hypothetical protein
MTPLDLHRSRLTLNIYRATKAYRATVSAPAGPARLDLAADDHVELTPEMAAFVNRDSAGTLVLVGAAEAGPPDRLAERAEAELAASGRTYATPEPWTPRIVGVEGGEEEAAAAALDQGVDNGGQLALDGGGGAEPAVALAEDRPAGPGPVELAAVGNATQVVRGRSRSRRAVGTEVV